MDGPRNGPKALIADSSYEQSPGTLLGTCGQTVCVGARSKTREPAITSDTSTSSHNSAFPALALFSQMPCQRTLWLAGQCLHPRNPSCVLSGTKASIGQYSDTMMDWGQYAHLPSKLKGYVPAMPRSPKNRVEE